MSSRFTARQIDAFLAVAELQNFRLAAARIHLTPSAVSNLVSELERAIGFSLFVRTTRKVALTREGRRFLPSAVAVQRQIALAIDSALDIRHSAVATVRIAAPLAVAATILPKLIAGRPCPNSNAIRIIDTPVVWLADRVLTGEADLAIGPDRDSPPHITRSTLAPTPWMLWLRPEHPLAHAREISWRSLCAVQLVAAGRDHEHSVWPQILAEGCEVPEHVQVVEHITTSLGLAAATPIATFSPNYVARLASAFGLVGRPLVDPKVSRSICLYSRSDEEIPSAVRAISEHIKAETIAHVASLDKV